MAYNVVPTVANGDSWSAAQHNTYIKDNFAAVWPYTTAGDLAYASASNILTRLGISSVGGILYSTGAAPAWLAKPSVDSVLRHTGGSVAPAWVSLTNLATALGIEGTLHNIATVDYNANDQTISSSSYADITNATVSIVTTRTCTIKMTAVGTIAAGGGGQRALVQGVIGGVASGDMVHTSMTVYVPFTVVYYRTGVAAGTIICKVQGRGNAGGNSGIFHEGRIVVEAFTE